MALIDELKKGDEIWVRFGAHGTQFAKVTQPVKQGKHGAYIKVDKWVKTGQYWVRNRQVYQRDIIERAE